MVDRGKRGNFWDEFGTVVASLSMWAAVILTCMGIQSCDDHYHGQRNARHRESLMVAVRENRGEFKVLWTYPVYGNKGRFLGHVVVCEGVKNGKRVEASS